MGRTLHDEAEHRARMEAAGRTDQLEAIFEAITDGLIVYNQQGHIIKMNTSARQILGIETQPEAFYSTPLEERVALYQIHDQFGRALSAEQTPAMRILHGETFTQHTVSDTQLCTPDKRRLRLNITGAPLYDVQ